MRIRILTYNIHKCIGGLDRRCRPDRISDVIAHHKPDFVLLQEVDEGAKRSRKHRQVDVLGDLLGLRHRSYFPNVRARGGGHYGNAILSRFPLTDTRNIDLSVPLSKKRSVLHARFRARATPQGRQMRTIHVFDLHLGLSQYLRKRQLEKFLTSQPYVLLHPQTPVILAGDFNDVWGTLAHKYLIPAGFRTIHERLRTFPAWAPIWPLDGVYVRGDIEILTVERSRFGPARTASDHLPLIADLRIT